MIDEWHPNENAHPDSTYDSDWMRKPFTTPTADKKDEKPAKSTLLFNSWDPAENAHPDSTFDSDWMRTPFKPSAAKATKPDAKAADKDSKPADKDAEKPAKSALVSWDPNYNAHPDSTYQSDWMRTHPTTTKTASSKDAKPAAKTDKSST